MSIPSKGSTRSAARPPGRAPARNPESEAASPGDFRDAQSEFLSILAHDLRTPLNAMVGWLHLLTSATGVTEELRQRALAGLQRAVEQQRRVVATLDAPRDFSDGYRAAPRDQDTSAPAAARTTRGERATQPVHSATPAHTGERPDKAAKALLAGVYVLAVDDDPDVLQMLQSLLEHSGAIVESTTSPDEALRRYASWASGGGDRLVLSDLAMQERDGITLMHTIRELERERHMRRLPAIALSAHFRPDTRREAFEGGFDLFLAKPIDPLVLLNHLRSMLDR